MNRGSKDLIPAEFVERKNTRLNRSATGSADFKEIVIFHIFTLSGILCETRDDLNSLGDDIRGVPTHAQTLIPHHFSAKSVG